MTANVQPDWHMRQIRKALRAGIILLLVVTALVALSFGVAAARATILGALLAWVAQLVQVWFSFRYRGARQAQHIYRSMLRGQLLKWLLIMLGFALLFSGLSQGGVATSRVLGISLALPLFALLGFMLVTLAFVHLFWRRLR